MLTETEAKTKWCPLATASHTDPRAGFNDEDKRPKTFPCMGSSCMAWQWFGYPTDEVWQNAVATAAASIGDTSSSRSKAVKHVNANREQYGLSMDRLGFCGAFMRPA